MMFPLKQVVDGTSEPAIEKLIRDIKVWLEETKGEKEMNSYANSFSSEIADDDYETAEVLYKEKEYTDAIPLFLSSAEHGNVNSQNKLCQILYDKVVPMEIIPNEYWDRIEKLATNDEDYANFLMHCKYYDDSANTNLSFEYVKRATKNAKVPLAFLRLGVSYGWGVGIKQNEILANHNYQKAIGLGCKEACSYIGQLYEYGSKKIEKDLSKALEYYKRGAELHDKRSMCKLANYYQYTLRQPADAKTVAQKMIDYGYYQGYVLMGDYCTYDSNRSWADTEEGKKWYRKALLFDEYEAYAQLAYIYWDVDQNYEEAYALAKQGAAKHNPPSIKALGIFYKIDNELEKSWNCYKEVFYRTGTASGMLGSLFFD
jgi:TPR repeat protein